MEDIQSDLREEIPSIEEDDGFYEAIQAPKFVDFSAPERSQIDDKSWFCLRMGCDQQHEEIEVNPDALYRSFMLRVMAARSPNVKFQKALNQVPRSVKKCPRTAPAKSVKDRVSRMSTITSIPNKIANAKLKNHPISSLGSTPIKAEAKMQTLDSEKKAITTPRAKQLPCNYNEPCRSVKHKTENAAPLKNKIVAKALFLSTPNKNDVNCDGMKKLTIGSVKKHANRGLISGKKDENSSCMRAKKNVEGVSIQGENFNATSNLNAEQKIVGNTLVLVAKESQRPENIEDDLKDNTILLEALKLDKTDEFEDDKENNSTTRNMNVSTANSETSENIPQKEMRVPSKSIQGHATQQGKVKRTTNPKPFRLRTNERGILKEANLERKIQLEVQKEISTVLKHGDVKNSVQQNATHEKTHKTTLEGPKPKPNQTRTPRVRYVESRYAKSTPKYHKLPRENRETEETKNKILKTASSIQNAQSVSKSRKTVVSQSRYGTKSKIEENAMANAACSKGKIPLIIRKEPNLMSRAPKSSTRKNWVAIP